MADAVSSSPREGEYPEDESNVDDEIVVIGEKHVQQPNSEEGYDDEDGDDEDDEDDDDDEDDTDGDDCEGKNAGAENNHTNHKGSPKVEVDGDEESDEYDVEDDDDDDEGGEQKFEDEEEEEDEGEGQASQSNGLTALLLGDPSASDNDKEFDEVESPTTSKKRQIEEAGDSENDQATKKFKV